MAIDFRDDPKTSTADLQAEIRRVVDQINDGGIVFSIPDVQIGTSSTPVAHGLGYPPKAALLVPHSSIPWRRSAPPDVFNVYFEADSPVEGDLIVFP